MKKSLFKILRFCVFILLISMSVIVFPASKINANASMPYYKLNPQQIVLRAKFFTTYKNSSEERKHNVALAVCAINKTIIDVGGEFSFNKVVGERTEKRGYKKAKIIVNGEFADGVGGGVCQVSSTLYNAILLSGLEITEVHPHSLSVSYVAPSFDAMVNSGWADLRFKNNTDNPVIILADCDGERITIKILGQPMTEKYYRKSVVIEIIMPEKEREIIDEKGEYPDLYEGEYMFLSYSKSGLKSEGYLIKENSGKEREEIKIRTDKYNATRGVVVKGTKALEDKLLDGKIKGEVNDLLSE